MCCLTSKWIMSPHQPFEQLGKWFFGVHSPPKCFSVEVDKYVEQVNMWNKERKYIHPSPIELHWAALPNTQTRQFAFLQFTSMSWKKKKTGHIEFLCSTWQRIIRHHSLLPCIDLNELSGLKKIYKKQTLQCIAWCITVGMSYVHLNVGTLVWMGPVYQKNIFGLWLECWKVRTTIVF